MPFDFASISVADSMSMNHAGMRYSLVSREIIADPGQSRSGVLEKYAAQVGSAFYGAVTHSGGRPRR